MADVIVWDNGAVTHAGPGYTAEGLAVEWMKDHPDEGKPFVIVPEELVEDHPSIKPKREAEAAAAAARPDMSNAALLARIEALENKL